MLALIFTTLIMTQQGESYMMRFRPISWAETMEAAVKRFYPISHIESVPILSTAYPLEESFPSAGFIVPIDPELESLVPEEEQTEMKSLLQNLKKLTTHWRTRA